MRRTEAEATRWASGPYTIDAGGSSRALAGQVAIVFQVMPRSLAASQIVATLVAVLFHSPETSRAWLAWWLTLLIVTGFRYAIVLEFRRKAAGARPPSSWVLRAVVLAAMAGALWGLCVTVLAPPWGDPKYILAVLMLAGIPAVSMVSNSALFRVYAAFAVPMLAPYAVFILSRSRSLEETFAGVAAIVYLVVLLSICKVGEGRIVESLMLRLENSDLVEKLSASNQELKDEVEERREAQEELLTAKVAAEAASEAKSRFLANMSHELRTPLNGILGMTELLASTPLTDQQRAYARHVAEEGASLLQIIDDVLDVARVEAGKLALLPEDVSLRELVDAAISFHMTTALSKGVRLHHRVAEGVPEVVRVDPVRLRQVLLNLIGNALKFTREGVVELDVEVDSAADPYLVRFTVRDTGTGMAAELLPRLFKPFVQADDSASRQAGGTGLGLSICRQLVTLMGGEIGVESTEGKGSTFWFTLRATAPLVPARPGEIAQSHPATGEVHAPLQGRVLLVEDNRVNREVAVAHLLSLGCTVESVGDGAAALAALERGSFDLVLMDCDLPGIDGYEATRAIRLREAGSSLPAIPIVALTAKAMDSERSRAIESGMNDFMSKPFSRDQLTAMLSRWLPRDGTPTQPR